MIEHGSIIAQCFAVGNTARRCHGDFAGVAAAWRRPFPARAIFNSAALSNALTSRRPQGNASGNFLLVDEDFLTPLTSLSHVH
jgi:hypothetical protein